MSRGFIKEGDQEEIPMVPPRAYLPKGMPNYVTREGLEALNKEREDLENERVASSGNYIMSNFIDAKIKLLIERINTAVEVDMTKANREIVSFGAWVQYNGRTVRIVGVDEADFSKGMIAFISPVAKSLVGKKVGDKFEIKVPKGTETVEIQGIWYECPPSFRRDDNNLSSFRQEPGGVEKSSTHFAQSKEIPRKSKAEIENNVSSAKAERSVEITDIQSVFIPEEDIMEFLPVVNERGLIVGRALHMELHQGNKILHPSVHLHVINNKGEVTRRYWWHMAFGETPEKTLKRKMSETLGLTGVKPKFKKQYIRETNSEKELVYVYLLHSEEELLKMPEEKDYLNVFARD